MKDDDEACFMNTYFTSIGEKLGLDPPCSITPLLSSDSLPQSKNVPSLSEVKLTEYGVLRQLKLISVNLFPTEFLENVSFE